MLRYLLRRAVQALVVLVGAAVLVFFLLQLVPGDPVRSAMGTRFNPETYEILRAEAGFDRPLHEQLISYLANHLLGNGRGRELGLDVVVHVQGVPAQHRLALLVLSLGVRVRHNLPLFIATFASARFRIWEPGMRPVTRPRTLFDIW